MQIPEPFSAPKSLSWFYSWPCFSIIVLFSSACFSNLMSIFSANDAINLPINLSIASHVFRFFAPEELASKSCLVTAREATRNNLCHEDQLLLRRMSGCGSRHACILKKPCCAEADGNGQGPPCHAEMLIHIPPGISRSSTCVIHAGFRSSIFSLEFRFCWHVQSFRRKASSAFYLS